MLSISPVIIAHRNLLKTLTSFLLLLISIMFTEANQGVAFTTPISTNGQLVIQAIIEGTNPPSGSSDGGPTNAKCQKFICLTTEQQSQLLTACTSQMLQQVTATSLISIATP